MFFLTLFLPQLTNHGNSALVLFHGAVLVLIDPTLLVNFHILQNISPACTGTPHVAHCQ